MIEISSKTNEHFKRWSDLNSSRGIRKHGEFFLMGEKLIEEFLKNPHLKVKAEIIHEDLKALSDKNLKLSKFQRVPLFKLPKALFNEIDFVGTHFNLFVLELPEIPNKDLSQKPEGLEMITPLGDPGNLGALIRSALAFGVSEVILTPESALPFLPKAIKGSAGAVLKMKLSKASSLAEINQASEQLFALDMQGTDVHKFAWPENFRLVVGEEGPGLKDLPRHTQKIRIQTAEVESLNAVVASSIALYSYSKRR